MVEAISPWSNWDPKSYLRDYYTTIEPDEIETIGFEVEAFRNISGNPSMIEIGCGPTLHHVFPVIPHVARVDLADFLPANLEEIRKWVNVEEGRHSWRSFIAYTLQCEQSGDPTESEILARKKLTRQRIGNMLHIDLSQTDPLGLHLREGYPLVASWYCADSATDDQATWEAYMRNIASVVSPGGILMTAALRRTNAYRVGERYFPSANVDEGDLTRVLKLDFDPRSITIEVRELKGHESQGYSGIILAQARKQI